MTLFLRASAEDDILRQFEWYAEPGRFDVAQRFLAAVREAIDALITMPDAGAPRHMDNPRLAGLRMWPVKRFDQFRVYYLSAHDAVDRAAHPARQA